MRLAMKVGSNLITVILAAFLIVTMYFAISSKISGGAPKIFGREMYTVLSGSMEPSIHTGSVIFDKPNVDANKLKVGDVITFKSPDNASMIITHRIQQVKMQDGKPAYQTKGDANDAPDSALVSASNVIAQYDSFTIPYLGYYLNFMKTKLGIGLLLILPGALLIISTIISLYREITKLQKKSDSKVSNEQSTDAVNA